MIYQASKTWFQTYGVLLKLLMIDMRHRVSHIGDNNDVHEKSGYSDARRIFNLEVEVIKKIQHHHADTTRTRSQKKAPVHSIQRPSGFIYVDDYKRNKVMHSDDLLAEEKMEQFGKEKSSFHDQGHQQAAKGKEDDEEFGEIRWFDTSAGNPVKKILLKLNLSDHRSILTDSKEYLKMVMERQSVKVKEIQERCIIKAFQDYQIKKGMSMSVQKSQVHEMAKFT
ncbi:hypothetical protein Tco_1392020 [Tanacetum coccineum]